SVAFPLNNNLDPLVRSHLPSTNPNPPVLTTHSYLSLRNISSRSTSRIPIVNTAPDTSQTPNVRNGHHARQNRQLKAAHLPQGRGRRGAGQEDWHQETGPQEGRRARHRQHVEAAREEGGQWTRYEARGGEKGEDDDDGEEEPAEEGRG
ncbi:hypothetical protein K432DRAFT_210161, partial [Lepidopterella palustris CBS 459.81]